MYYIYLVTSPSGKRYVGLTTNFERRKREHSKKDSRCLKLKRAIAKYGKLLKWDIIDTVLTESDAKALEILRIKEYDSVVNGYNLSHGGDFNVARRKLSNIEINQIRKDLVLIPRMQDIANKHNVSISTISEIKDNKRWRFLDDAKVTERKSMCLEQIGEHNPNARLTDEIVINMKKDYMTDKYTIRKLAQKYNIGFSLAQSVLSETWWKHVTVDGYDYQSIAKKRDANKKLTEEQARQIKLDLKNGRPRKDIALEYNISRSTVDGIVNGKLWKNIE